MSKTLNLVFDLDGTLIDSAPDIHAAANIVFQNKGLQTFSYETVRGFVGNGAGVLVSRLLMHLGLSPDGDLHRELMVDYSKNLEEAFGLTVLYPGAFTALETLASDGHRLAICTNKPERPARAALRHFGLEALFPVVIGGDSLPQRKPDPRPLHAAIEALGGGPSLFVGDSEVDAETALAADVPLALYSGGYRKAAPETLGAKLIFDDHAALPGLVTHLARRF